MIYKSQVVLRIFKIGFLGDGILDLQEKRELTRVYGDQQRLINRTIRRAKL